MPLDSSKSKLGGSFLKASVRINNGQKLFCQLLIKVIIPEILYSEI